MLDATCRHKFRDRADVNQYLFRYWQLASAGLPQKARQHLSYHRQAERVGGGAAAAGGKYRVVCVNDDPMDFDFDTERQQLMDIFQRAFPQISAFERS